MTRNLSGLKIRSWRKRNGLTQRELARRAGISTSYLNHIELNKRPVAGVLLDRIAEGLGVERAVLDGKAERRVVETLYEIAADSAIAGNAPPRGAAEELVGRYPGWSDLILRLYRAYLDGNQAVIALADRLNRDPFLGESVHRMLTNVTSIHAAAEILQGDDALDEADRGRFLRIVASDSEKLSETAQSLLAFFDNAHHRIRSATPAEHVDSFIFEADNHFPALERCAEDFLRKLPRGMSLEAWLEERAARAAEDGQGDRTGRPPAESRRFALAARAVAPRASDAIREILDGNQVLASDEARDLAATALNKYAAAAVVMPYAPFLEAAEEFRYDIDRLTALFGVSYEQAAHRLATLRRPGAEGVRFAFMRSDASGYVTKRLPLPALPLPRYGTACPLWIVYGAFQTPGATQRNFGRLPTEERFLFFARAIDKETPAIGYPRHLLSVMLACAASDADRVVYGDGIDRVNGTIEVGTVCRLCPRENCGHRQEERLIA